MAKRVQKQNWCVIVKCDKVTHSYLDVHGPYPSREKALVAAEFLRTMTGDAAAVSPMHDPSLD